MLHLSQHGKLGTVRMKEGDRSVWWFFVIAVGFTWLFQLPRTLDSRGIVESPLARMPYAVSFCAGNETVILVTLHVDYGDTSADRIHELTGSS
jgi:hypothetical protein